MKRIKKPLSLSRETIRPLSRVVLSDVAGAMEDSRMCSTNPRCFRSTDLKCPTFGSDCCLASVLVC